jgi:hypothetical protein
LCIHSLAPTFRHATHLAVVQLHEHVVCCLQAVCVGVCAQATTLQRRRAAAAACVPARAR